MERGLRSRIPRPAAPPAALQQLDTNVVAYKRKAEPRGKENAGATKRRAVVTTTAPAAEKPTAATCKPAALDGDEWESVAQETGWTVEDALAHKVAFPKRADAKAKLETLGTHIKRLRAAGWHLLSEKQKLGEQRDALAGSTSAAESAAAQAAAAAEAAAHEAAAQLQGARRQLADAERSAATSQERAGTLAAKLAAAAAEAEAARAEAAREAAERAASARQAEQLLAQVSTLSSLSADTQQYNAQLQQYNARVQADLAAATEALQAAQADKAELSEQCAALRGRAAATEEALAALREAGAGSEAARGSALREAAELRAALSAEAAGRAAAAAEAARLRVELEQYKEEAGRYRAATGKDVAALELERASREVLESRTRAQAELAANLNDQLALARERCALAEAQADKRSGEAAALAEQVRVLEAALAEAEAKVRAGEVLRRRLHNTIQELKGNIRVFCRVRPPAEGEAAEAAPGQPTVAPVAEGEAAGSGLELVQRGPREGALQRHAFNFDRVFGPAASQAEVFEEISQLAQSALDGYKVCIFAYGQTGSGKTHTMLGSPEDPGMIPRAMEQLFSAAGTLREQGWAYEMRASVVEIYNEELRCLLGGAPPAGKKHQVLHDDKAGTTSVSHVEVVDVSQPDRVQALLARAMKQRAVGATNMNDQSSRSHMVFTLNIDGCNAETGQAARGVLNLIDLAGSERVSRSGAAGDRLKEAQAINKSLAALGDVVAALGSKEAHVPFRNSKLTFLLQQSLGGSAKTLMFVNVAPSAESAPESLCSLRFAAKVNACEIGTARRTIQAAPAAAK